ncbi:MAG: DNA polymerase III subunit alpha, partial [Syntrophaceae bacterium]|nr:DNA polymerase III subunit alpha [Syntrophaceae bacterium]
ESLCRRVRELGMDRVALTDTNGVYGLVLFLQIAEETGIRPIVGAEVVTSEEHAILLVKSQTGYGHLCRILTNRHCNEDFDLAEDLITYGKGLIILSDQPDLLKRLKEKCDLYAELTAGRSWHALLDFARSENIPVVATGDVTFIHPEEHHLHCLLRAIDLNTKLSRLPIEETAPASAWLKSPQEMAEAFPNLPEARENTQRIADQCNFRPDFASTLLAGFDKLDQKTAVETLRRKCYEGAKWRYREMTDAVRKRLEYELSIISGKGFASVFLMMEDIVKQAPRTCGRGSAAASIVSYTLGITHVDPLKYYLFFERFLNPGRQDPPDIDVDFPWDERDAILDYVFEKYGPERSAMVANHVGFRLRAAVREVAKVYGLSDGEIKQVTDRLSHLWYWGADDIESVVATHPLFRGLSLDDPWTEILKWASQIQGKPRYLSVHCGGVVVVPGALSSHVPVENAPKGVQIIQWEKDQTEDGGLIKMDLLGNRSLAVIRDSLNAIRLNTGEVIRYEDLNPLDDPDTQNLIRRGDTMGVFYIESPAMRQLQKKTGVGDYEHLVIHSSIIRPAANTFINEYVRRLHGESYHSLHPILDRVLGETYGIMVYQEDVTKVAMEMAGFSPEDGDGLRKTLSKKRNAKKLSAYKEQFVQGALARKISPDVIEKVWEMILSFGGYSFCKPHSASYALVSFKSAWLRAHYPAEFMAAVISNKGGYYSPFAYISEARRMGLSVLLPDINASHKTYTGRGREIRVGLMQLKGLKASALDRLLEEREEGGPYLSFEAFLRRVPLDPSDMRILIKAGCFDKIAGGRSRAELLWQVYAGRKPRAVSPQTILPLFDEEAVRIPQLGDYDFRTLLLHEVEVLGFPLSIHPLDLYRDNLENIDYIPGKEIGNYIGRRITMIGWWVTNKLVYTKNEEPMSFISFEDTTALYETIFFPDTFRRFCSEWTQVRPYILRGRVEDDLGAVSLHVEEMSFLDKKIDRTRMKRIGRIRTDTRRLTG